MLNLTARRALILALCPLALVRELDAQVPECVNGASTFRGHGAAAEALQPQLDALLWRSAHADYARLFSAHGALTAYDTLTARAAALLVATNARNRSPIELLALEARLTAIRAALHSAQPIPTELPDYSDLAVQTGLTNGVADFVESGGERIPLRFAGDALVSAIALCATARTVHSFMDLLANDQLNAVAQDYADASRRWDLYVEKGYSMTFLERWGNSCRPGYQLIAIAAIARCRSKGIDPLGPPSVRTIFAHPSAGLSAYRSGTTNFPAVSVMEWYGLVGHKFARDRILSLGVSAATFYPLDGRPMNGILVHTPVGKVGAFDLANFSPTRRPQIVMTADVAGWIPGIRSAARSVAWKSLFRPELARTVMTIASTTP